MFPAPALFMMAMTRFRKVAMTRGPFLVRTWEESSLKVTSRSFSRGAYRDTKGVFPVSPGQRLINTE